MLARSVGVRRSSALRLDDHRILAAAVDVGGDLARRQHGLQGLADRLDADPQIVRLGPIDAHLELRLVALEIGLDVAQARVLLGAAQDRVAPCLDALVVRAADHDLERRAAAAHAEAGRAGRGRARARQRGELREQRARQLLRGLRARVPVGQANHHERPMRLAAHADDGEHPLGDAALAAAGRRSPRPCWSRYPCSRWWRLAVP